MCPKCQQYVALTLEQYEQTVAELKTRSAETLVALAEGDSEITFDSDQQAEQPIDCVSYLTDVIDWLHDSGEESFVNEMIARLGQAQQPFAKQMMQAELLRIKGQRRDAIEQFVSLMNKQNERSLPAIRAASLLGLEKRHSEAAEAWGKALEIEKDSDQRIGMLALRVDSLMAAKLWTEAVKTYDELFELQPAIAEDKSVKQAYRKAMKKSGNV